MKKILMLFMGLGFAGGIEVFALATPAPSLPAFGNLPLYFTAVSGKGSGSARFVAHGSDCQFLIQSAEAQFDLQKTDPALGKTSVRTLRMEFLGARSQAQIQGADELPGKVNYLIGANPSQWRTGVATYAQVRVAQLYPGVNLVYYGNQRRLEYDLTVAPGANPDAIKIHFAGVDNVSVGAQGELILSLGGNEIRQLVPVIYQVVDGERRIVSGGYRLLDAHTVAFAVGKYDDKLPLVIDPVLSFSTYFGGSGSDSARSIALDTNGYIYITGQTISGQLGTPGAFQTNFVGGNQTGDAFVAKFGNQGSNLIYFTYLGGSSDDQANAITVDRAGDAFVTGFTDSQNFPTTTNALYRNISGTPTPAGYFIDAFVSELNPSGSNLVYSTYLGGSGPDGGNGIALDSSNNIYVVGHTGSPDLPVTANAFQKHLACPFSIYTTYLYANAFLAEISASGTNLLYSSYFGGTNLDIGEGITIDSSNNVYITGYTASTNFPTTNALFQQFFQTNVIGTTNQIVTNVINGSLLNGATGQTIENQTTPFDAFVTKFSPGCTSVIYSTFLGGTNSDVANGIAVDGTGNAYVTGWTVSTNFPNTVTTSNLYNGLTNNLVYGYSITTNVFLTQITQNGPDAAIGWSTVFGGTNFGMDVGYGVTLDKYGNIFVVGASSTTNFPAVNTPGLLSTTNAGGNDAFVIALSPNVSNVIYSGYLGGSGNDYGYGIAVDSSTNVYIVGQTASANFPVFNARQSSLNGSSDAFLAEIGSSNVPPEITDQSSLTNQTVEATLQSVTFSVTATGTPPLYYQWQVAGPNLTGTNLVWTNLVTKGNIYGATNATLSMSPAETNNTGIYRVVVSNYAGSVTSSNAVLTVTAAPTITTQPTNQTVGAGSSVTFSIDGYAISPYFFQWQKEGIDLTDGTNAGGSIISGATNYALTINNVQTNDAGNYWIIVSNNYGAVTSEVATLTVDTFPIILVGPTNQTVGLGSGVTFAVQALGTTPLSYQWQKNGNNLLNSGHITGVTGSTLTINSAQAVDSGGYSVVITNVEGAVTSAPPAVLAVLTSPLFGNIAAATNGGFELSGVGGISSSTYYVLASTNLATPLAQWTPIATNQFGSQGQFDFTTTPSTNAPQQFYLLETPP